MQSDGNHASPTAQLRPVLGLFSAGAIVVGGVIGTGIFLKPSLIAEAFLDAGGGTQSVRAYVPLILLLWAVCGLVNLCGALALAELSAMIPHAGGTYLFLREAYGRMWAFLWGWAEFWVIRSGSIAALSAGLAITVTGLLDEAKVSIPEGWDQAFQIGLAVIVISTLATVNIIGTRWGGAVQNATTVVKVGFVAFLGALPFFVSPEAIDLLAIRGTVVSGGLLAAIGVSLSAIMWAYDGWGNVTVIAEEIRNPQANIPRALGGGLILLSVLYVGANVAYHMALPFERIAQQGVSPAEKQVTAAMVTETLWGNTGARLVLAMMLVSIFGAINNNVLIGPRIVFAVARDFSAFRFFRRIDPRSGTPAPAIAALAVWACCLILAAPLNPNPKIRLFDVLTNYCLFGGSLFYLAAVLAVFVLRYKRPEAHRPYRTWGYPLTPLLFAIFYVPFLAGMVWTSTFESVTGLALIGSGLIFYALVRRSNARSV
jgi:APA family basic amino acid/polyamine antiporter